MLASPSAASSSFTIQLTPNNTFDLLLDVSGGSTSPGAPVIDWWANGHQNQWWTFEAVTGRAITYQIINQNSGQCLTTDGVPGDQVYQMPCNGGPAQQWFTGLNPSTNPSATIQSVSSGLFLDVSHNSPWPGASLDTWYYNGGYNQQFNYI